MIRSFIATGAIFLFAASAFAAPSPTPAPAVPPILPLPVTQPAQPPAKPFVYKPKESDVVSGKENAPVTVVEYASLSCPHCAHFYKETMPVLTAKYVDTGKVKFVFRNYLRNSVDLAGARLIECVSPDRRPVFIKVLFDTQMKWVADSNVNDALENIAALGGIERAKFESCMKDKAVNKAVLDVGREAADDYRVNSTPTFYINNTLYQGTFDAATMDKAIDRALEKKGK